MKVKAKKYTAIWSRYIEDQNTMFPKVLCSESTRFECAPGARQSDACRAAINAGRPLDNQLTEDEIHINFMFDGHPKHPTGWY